MYERKGVSGMNDAVPDRCWKAQSKTERSRMPADAHLALKLIKAMTAKFDPAKYHGTYIEDVKKLIEDSQRDRYAKLRRPSLPAAMLSSWLPPHCRRAWRKKSRGNAALPEVDQIRRHLSRPPPST